MADRTKIAVIGLGRMGGLYARTITTRVPSAELYAVADPNPETLAAIQAEFGVSRASADPDDVFALAEVDAVIIATPTSTHGPLAMAAAAAGKAIFCEKPLSLSLAETDLILDAVERSRVPLQVGFNRRFDAGYQRAKRLIDEGQIGRPITFKAVGRDPFCPRVEFADPAKSGGLITDMGIHDCDLARWLMGSEVERVSAEGGLLVCQDLQAVGDIDNAVVNLRFASGALGNIELSRNAFYGYDIRTEVLGSEGAVMIGAHQHTPVLLLTRAGAQHDVTPYLMERFGDAYQAQIQDFVDCVRQRRAPVVGGSDARAAFAITLAATRSTQTGRSVALTELENG